MGAVVIFEEGEPVAFVVGAIVLFEVAFIVGAIVLFEVTATVVDFVGVEVITVDLNVGESVILNDGERVGIVVDFPVGALVALNVGLDVGL
jgi:hypothetical protein